MCYGTWGVVGATLCYMELNRNNLESLTAGRESRVRVSFHVGSCHLSRAGHVESCLNLRVPSRKAKYS